MKIVNDDPPIVEGISILVGLYSVVPSLATKTVSIFNEVEREAVIR